MKKRQSVLVIFLFSLAGCSPSRMICDPLMVTSTLDGTLNVTVPPQQADELNRRVVGFLDSNGFSIESSASDTYLGPPDANMHQEQFRNIKTIGCTAGTVVWSENVIGPNEFLITFHHTAFGSRKSTQKLLTELAEAINPARKP